MSQSRNPKVLPHARYTEANSDNASRLRRPKARDVVGGSRSRSTHPPSVHHKPRKNESKNKIPKSMRYDLESALVGLCDVWFENIKPHLVRNNIKLHVHNTEAAAAAACACGDLKQPATSEPPCNHLDPGAATDLPRHKAASYAGSYAMQPIVSEVPCIKQQTSILQQNQTSYENHQKFQPNSKTPMLNKPKSPTRRVSRLCQTYTMAPALKTEPTLPAWERNVYAQNLFKSIFNKAPVCPPTSPSDVFPKSKQIGNIAAQTMRTNTQMYNSVLENSRSFRRPRTTASLSPPRAPPKPLQDQLNLFQNDLIDIIGKRNDKVLRNSCNNQEKEYPSLVYLVSPNRRQKANSPKKNPPWR